MQGRITSSWVPFHSLLCLAVCKSDDISILCRTIDKSSCYKSWSTNSPLKRCSQAKTNSCLTAGLGLAAGNALIK